MDNTTFDRKLYDKGFLYEDATVNKLEDFASFAENIFINQPVFWEAVSENEKLRAKFEIISEYYESLDSSMNKNYFLELNNITLSNNR